MEQLPGTQLPMTPPGGQKKTVGRNIRSRSRRACIACRTRKVRCDADQNGLPCTNCRLDDKKCFTRPRAKRRCFSTKGTVRDSLSDAVEPAKNCALTAPKHQIESQSSPCGFYEVLHFQNDLFSKAQGGSQGIQSSATDPSMEGGIPVGLISFSPAPEEESYATDMLSCSIPPDTCSHSQTTTSTELKSSSACQLGVSELPSEPNTNFVLFSCFGFLEMEALASLDPDTAVFLNSRGCLHLPNKLVLHKFIQQYFLHVHPLLPIINESEFWSVYLNPQGSDGRRRFSLILIQAMLFISSAYVHLPVLHGLGFTTARDARAKFYSRTKTLLDLVPCENNIVNAQVALLLTYFTQSTNDRINTYWLTVAIHHAKTAKAPDYQSPDNTLEQKRKLKRLWWCCILRDRIMALSLRRSLQINPWDFDFSQSGLTSDDLGDEIDGSMVYSRTTKQVLVQLMTMLCELGVLLNDLLPSLYPENRTQSDQLQQSPKLLMALSTALDRWYEKAFLLFRIPTSLSDAHKSLILFTNMTYTYYNIAQACLCTRIMLLTVTPTIKEPCQEFRLQAQAQFNRSISNINDDLMELEQLGLTKYLPNTFIRLSVLSYIWHTLSTELIPPSKASFLSSQMLQTYTNIMKGFEDQYETAEETLQCAETIVSSIQARETSGHDSQLRQPPPSATWATVRDSMTQSSVSNVWVSILVREPQKYLRILLAVEYSLSNGHLPAEVDFPKALHTD